MSDHKFERQVRQKLGDLKLTPTPQSWEKIENEIRERKRRRVPIFWLPLLLLGLGVGGYFLLTPGEKKLTTAQVMPKTVVTQQTKTNPKAEVIDEKTAQPVDEPSATVIPQSSTVNPPVRNNDTKKRYRTATRAIPGTGEQHKSSGEEVIKEPAGKQPENTSAQQQSEQEAGEQPASKQKETTTTPVTLSDEPKKLIAEEKTSTQETPKPAEQKKQDKKENKKKWSFGVTGLAGVSAISEGKFVNFSGAQVEDVRATPDLSGNFFGSPMVAAPPPPAPPPSKLEPTFSYSIGVTAKRELSERFSLSAGVSYLQMNTVTKVGYQMNNRQIVNNDLGYNVVDRYYLPSQDYVNKYKNRYHFLEVPVTLHTRLIRSQKLPVYWNAGVSANILLGSNALHYDGNTGVYYKDEALLNQVQGGVSTGLSFSLFNKSKTPLWVGPTARYNFSPVLKRSVSTSKNLMGLGIDLRWYLK